MNMPHFDLVPFLIVLLNLYFNMHPLSLLSSLAGNGEEGCKELMEAFAACVKSAAEAS